MQGRHIEGPLQALDQKKKQTENSKQNQTKDPQTVQIHSIEQHFNHSTYSEPA